MAGEMSSILRELEQVQDQIGSLTKDDLEEKTALLSRQETLRTRAARLADQVNGNCSTQDLLGQLASLRRQRDALARQRRTSTQPKYSASPPNGVAGHRRSPHGDIGVPRIDERIHRIRQMLSDRGIRLT